jgi:hypothetical protein
MGLGGRVPARRALARSSCRDCRKRWVTAPTPPGDRRSSRAYGPGIREKADGRCRAGRRPRSRCLHLHVIEPGVDVAGLGLRLERRARLVPNRLSLAGEVADAELVRQRLDIRIGAFVEHPAVVRVANRLEGFQLLGDHVEGLVRRDAQRDHRHPPAWGGRHVHRTPHAAHEEPVEARQEGAQVCERGSGDDVEPERSLMLRTQPPRPEVPDNAHPQACEHRVGKVLWVRHHRFAFHGPALDQARGEHRCALRQRRSSRRDCAAGRLASVSHDARAPAHLLVAAVDEHDHQREQGDA